jgi:hypothetical protein
LTSAALILRDIVSKQFHTSIKIAKGEDMQRNARGQLKFRFGLSLALLIVCTLAGCGATGKIYVPVEPEADTALIYIYRPDRFLGSGNVWYLRTNEAQVTAVRNGGWFAFYSKPGDVTFYSNLRPGVGTLLPGMLDSDKEMITISAEAGQTYFVKFDHHMSGPYMELVDKSTGESEIQGLRMMEPIE